MQIESLLTGLYLIKPKVFEDHRGHFFESFREDVLKENGVETNFVQDNQSFSQAGAVRGLHAQANPFAQGKLVRVIQGKVLDIAVDIRRNSPTYGQHFSLELSAENFKMFYIPPGFLHGFSTLENNTIFSYKCTNLYNKDSEIGVIWNDKDLNIDWQINPNELILSCKDLELQSFKD